MACRCRRRPGAASPPSASRRRSLSSPGDPRPGRPFRRAVRRSSASSRCPSSPRVRPIDVAEALPRPARSRPARERPARPQRPLDVPDGRSRRGPRPSPRPAAIRSPSPGASLRPPRRRTPPTGRPRRARRAAVPRRPRRLPRLRAGRRARAAAGARRRRPGPAARSASRSTTGSIAWDRRTGARVARRAGRSTATRERLDRRLADVRERLRPSRGAGAGRASRDRTSGAADGTAFTLVARPRRAYEAGVEAIRDRIAARRHLPGEPDAPARDAVRRRPVAALPPPPDRRSVAVLGVPRPRRRRAGSRSVLGSAPARPRAILSASPEPFLASTRHGQRLDRPDQGHAAARPDARRGPRPRLRAARVARRTGPRT